VGENSLRAGELGELSMNNHFCRLVCCGGLYLGFIPLIAAQATGEKTGVVKEQGSDGLPAKAIARLGTTKFRCAPEIEKPVWTPNGRYFIAVASDQLRVLDALSGVAVRRLDFDEGIDKLAVSPNSRILAVGLFRSIIILDVETRNALRRLEPVGEKATALAFLGDSKTLITTATDTNEQSFLQMWDSVSGKEVKRVAVGLHRMPHELLSCSAKRLAACTAVARNDVNRTIQIWDVLRGKLLQTITCDAGVVIAAAFSPSERLLATVAEGEQEVFEGTHYDIELWDLKARRQVGILTIQSTSRPVLEFGDDERLTVAGTTPYWTPHSLLWLLSYILDQVGAWNTLQNYETLCLWDAESGRRLGAYARPPCEFRGLSRAKGGELLAYGVEHAVIRVWDVRSGKLQGAGTDGPTCGVWGVAFSSDDKQILALDGAVARYQWRISSRKAIAHQFLVDAGSLNPRVPLRVLNNGECLFRGKYSTDNSDPFLYHLRDGNKILTTQLGDARYAFLSPDGATLATSAGAGEIQLWATRPARWLTTVQVGGDVDGIAVSADRSRLAVIKATRAATGVPRSCDLELWDITKRRKLTDLWARDQRTSEIAFSSDGRYLASRTYSTDGHLIQLWDMSSFQRAYMKGFTEERLGVSAFTPDSHVLAFTIRKDRKDAEPENTIRMVEVYSGQVRQELHWCGGPAAALAFSHDGRLLASGNEDTTILIWDITGLRSGGSSHRQPLAKQQAAAAWQALCNLDASKAQTAMWALATSPTEAIPLLRDRLRPRQPLTRERIIQLITALSSDRFRERKQAEAELIKLEELPVAEIQRTLAGNAGLDVRQRLESILRHLITIDQAEELGALRGIEVLEQIGTKSAQEILACLAQGAPPARVTQEAKAALNRLASR
jgi:WD40 repeat protein